mgnify:CR=1 FL=1
MQNEVPLMTRTVSGFRGVAAGIAAVLSLSLLGGCGFWHSVNASSSKTTAAEQVDLAGNTKPVAINPPAPPEPKIANANSGKQPAGAVPVNNFLWRASLDTLSFMPLAAADPFGGTIITDWYAPPETPDERFKATVYILDKRLRADAVRVSLFRQTRDKRGEWADTTLDPATRGKIEDAILTHARQLRLASNEK